ncbi:hypothetical protein KC19_12G136100 [Ceratodon purpureus]|uniref:Uncharacterized protein n=2 Tax=Ceratodon purpureus TaxID=3225 RepID=A0A8T0G6W6_CERPU|nr:hypothetical protein KC19_12G136100 [Ceratodon purpureus]KAG0555003.1 hypothetical protein KC19_12G136100 [Ceratodon purpureus]
MVMALRSLDIAALSISSAPARIPSLATARARCGGMGSGECRSFSVASTSGSESEAGFDLSRVLVKCSRREGISTALLCATAVVLGQALNPGAVLAEESVKKEEGGSFVDGVLELLDPDQVTKTGKKLPKKYVKSVREVVKNLRESFNQDSKDGAKFRRNADSAKESIREYLQNWRGSKIVETEDSYVALERAFRELGKFYSSKGPQAALPEDIRNRVLEDLNKADDSI